MINIPKMVRNFASLTAGKVVGDGFTFLLFIALSRAYGKEGIGQYSYAMALTSILGAFSDFGLYHFSIKEMSKAPGPLGKDYSVIFALRVILSLLTFGLLIGVMPFLSFSSESKMIILIMGAYQVLYRIGNGFAAVFCGSEEMHIAGLLEFSLRLCIAIFGVVVILMGGGLIAAIWVFPVVTFFQLVIAYKLVTIKHGEMHLAIEWKALLLTFRSVLPYGLAGILFIVGSRVDVLFLGFFLDEGRVGLYNVAYRQVFLLTFVPHFVAISIFPVISKLFLESPNEFKDFYNKILNLSTLLGIPFTIGLWLIAPALIGLLFGIDFLESSSVLRILSGLIFLGFWESTLATFLMACDKEFDRTNGYWIAACSNILGNFILIPKYGIQGAAVATLTSKLLQVSFYTLRIYPMLGWPRVGKRLGMGLISAGSFFIPFSLLPSFSIGLVIPVSMILYCGSLYLFREVRENEFSTIMALVRRAT